MNIQVYYDALFIRKVEEAFLNLFSKGRLNGTVHTCIGQEFSALAFAGQLERTDFIFSTIAVMVTIWHLRKTINALSPN